MTIRRTPALSVAAAALTLLTVAGCDDKGADSAAPTASATASASTASSPTAAGAPSAGATPTAATATTAARTPAAPPAAAAGGAPADASGAFDPEVALTHPDTTPYAATMKMTTEAGEGDKKALITANGRVNLNAPTYEGRMEMKTTLVGADEPLLWLETIAVGDKSYLRDKSKPDDTWAELPTGQSDDSTRTDFTRYAKLLLAGGPSVRKGMETEGGIPVYHLAGQLTIDQIASVDPKNGATMKAKGAKAMSYQVWIDRLGRTIRAEQSGDVKGMTTVLKISYSEFGPKETFTAPAVTG
ncbi:hypothetical protein [Kitasatospora sp. NPDC097643]|uniref:hypothetical protein n=1 Tax=Kitasatospora sp. NPDC097643 TaxID=3157230 RepID=UPI00332B1B6C